MQAAAFDELDVPVARVGAPFTPVPFSPPLEDGWLPVNSPSFAYPKRDLDPESKNTGEWSAEANRKPLDELVSKI